MFKRIRLRNFKCFEDAEVSLNRLNILIGENGSGKSSIIHGFLALKQSLGSEVLNLNYYHVRLGTYDDVVFKHEAERNIGFEIEFHKSLPELKDLDLSDIHVRYSVFFKSDLSLRYHESRIKVGKYEIFVAYNSDTDESRVDPGEISPIEGVTLRMETRSHVGLPFYVTASPSLQHRERNLFEVIVNTLRGLRFVPSMRGFTDAEYPLGDKESFEFLNYSNISSVAVEILSTIAYNEELEAKLSDALHNTVDTKIRHRNIHGRNITLASDMAKRIVNEGFGLNQLSWLFSQVIQAPNGSLILIEEPEIHLHPRAQSKLMDILIKIVKKENKQLIVTTHSEHILLRLLTNVANGNLKPDDVSVYYFERSKKPEKLDVDEKGRLDKGLKGFFEYEVSELSEYLKVLGGKGD